MMQEKHNYFHHSNPPLAASLPFDSINFYKLDMWKCKEDKLILMYSVNTVKFLLLSTMGL